MFPATSVLRQRVCPLHTECPGAGLRVPGGGGSRAGSRFQHRLAACPRPAPFIRDDYVCTLGRGPVEVASLLRAASPSPGLGAGPP